YRGVHSASGRREFWCRRLGSRLVAGRGGEATREVIHGTVRWLDEWVRPTWGRGIGEPPCQVDRGHGGRRFMRLGALLMPSHPPERAVRDGQRWDLEEIERLDDLGFDEAWIGEHFTAAWEPCPAPDLLIAQALQRTRQIRLGPLGHLLPYHHPVELAHRGAYLDHLAEGRYPMGLRVHALPR